MFKELLVLLLLGHVVGEYYVQTPKMVQQKAIEVKWIIIHAICYGVMMVVSIIPIFSIKMLFVAMFIAIIHLLIELIKYKICSGLQKSEINTLHFERNIFLYDQIAHIIMLFVTTYLIILNNVTIGINSLITDFFEVIGVSGMKTLLVVLAILIVHKPANTLIQKLLIIYKPKEENNEEKEKDNNAGRLIGTIERIIMLIFLALGQYAALGLVLTAKSIARYDRISKDKDFAEYYLLGTLLSTLIVVVVSFLL